MNYVFRYVGNQVDWQNENRFYYDTLGVDTHRTVRSAFHATRFNDAVVDIKAISAILRPDFKVEPWTDELQYEDAYKTPPPGWWIPLVIFGGILLALAVSFGWTIWGSFHPVVK